MFVRKRRVFPLDFASEFFPGGWPIAPQAVGINLVVVDTLRVPYHRALRIRHFESVCPSPSPGTPISRLAPVSDFKLAERVAHCKKNLESRIGTSV
jgi:hypothetical protein